MQYLISAHLITITTLTTDKIGTCFFQLLINLNKQSSWG